MPDTKSLSPERLTWALQLCLLNNQLFDAALSAMAYTLLGMAALADPGLRDPAKYVMMPDMPANVHQIDLPGHMLLHELTSAGADLARALGNEWNRILIENAGKVVADSVHAGLIPASNGTYILRMIYMVVPEKAEA